MGLAKIHIEIKKTKWRAYLYIYIYIYLIYDFLCIYIMTSGKKFYHEFC